MTQQHNYESWRISYQSSESAAQAAWKEMIRLHHRVNELEAARIAYASEFEPDADGVPDVGNIHANIRALKAQLSAIGAGGVEPLRGSRHVHECREALAACIKLLKKTPKITRDIYVGKDRQAWGVQAQAVLDAALAALNQEDEK